MSRVVVTVALLTMLSALVLRAQTAADEALVDRGVP